MERINEVKKNPRQSIDIFYPITPHTRRNRDEYHPAGMFRYRGGMSEFFKGGSQSEDDPAGSQPPNPLSGGGTGGQTVPPHQQERFPDPGGPSLSG